MLVFAFSSDINEDKVVKGIFNWEKFIKADMEKSVDMLKRGLAIECPVLCEWDIKKRRFASKVKDFPSWHIVERSYCESFCMGQGCEDFEKCWGCKPCNQN